MSADLYQNHPSSQPWGLVGRFGDDKVTLRQGTRSKTVSARYFKSSYYRIGSKKHQDLVKAFKERGWPTWPESVGE